VSVLRCYLFGTGCRLDDASILRGYCRDWWSGSTEYLETQFHTVFFSDGIAQHLQAPCYEMLVCMFNQKLSLICQFWDMVDLFPVSQFRPRI